MKTFYIAASSPELPCDSVRKLENIAMLVAIGAKITHGPFNISAFDTAIFIYRHTDAAKIILQSGYNMTRVDTTKLYDLEIEDYEEFKQFPKNAKKSL